MLMNSLPQPLAHGFFEFWSEPEIGLSCASQAVAGEVSVFAIITGNSNIINPDKDVYMLPDIGDLVLNRTRNLADNSTGLQGFIIIKLNIMDSIIVIYGPHMGVSDILASLGLRRPSGYDVPLSVLEPSGKAFVDLVLDSIRTLATNCAGLQGFFIIKFIIMDSIIEIYGPHAGISDTLASLGPSRPFGYDAPLSTWIPLFPKIENEVFFNIFGFTADLTAEEESNELSIETNSGCLAMMGPFSLILEARTWHLIGSLEFWSQFQAAVELDGKEHYMHGSMPGFLPRIDNEVSFNPVGLTAGMTAEEKNERLSIAFHNGCLAMLGPFHSSQGQAYLAQSQDKDLASRWLL